MGTGEVGTPESSETELGGKGRLIVDLKSMARVL
jgi:hypothetical protein